MSDDAWRVEFAPGARRDLRRLDPQVQRRVFQSIEDLVSSPRTASLRKLTGRPEWRLRVGDWRVLLELDGRARTVSILRILPRGRAYDR